MNAACKTRTKTASAMAASFILALGSGCIAPGSDGSAYQQPSYYGTPPVMVDSVGQKQMQEIFRLRQQYDMRR